MNPDTQIDCATGYPNVLLQFLFYAYNNAPDYLSVFMTQDVLNGLVACLFPLVAEPGTPLEQKFVLIDNQDANLTVHRAKKTLMDFLRTIVVDSLSLPVTSTVPGSKPVPVIDIILDACPESATYTQQCQFQTELLSVVLDYLTAAGTIIGENGVLPVVSHNGGSVQHVAPNVFYLAGRMVDKLWLGVLSKDPHSVFDFIVQLVVQTKKKGGSTSGSGSAVNSTLGAQSLDNLYRCLNRCTLYLLSRPVESIAQQTSVLETLHKLTTHRFCLVFVNLSRHHFNFFFSKFEEPHFWIWQPRFGVYRLSVSLSRPVDVVYEDQVRFNHFSNLGESIYKKFIVSF